MPRFIFRCIRDGAEESLPTPGAGLPSGQEQGTRGSRGIQGTGTSTLVTELPGLQIRIHFIRIRIQHFRLNAWIPIWIQGFNDQKLKKNYSWKIFFWIKKTTIYISLGLLKERPSYWRSRQLSKEAIQHFKTWNFLIFFLLLWVIFALLDRIRNGFRIRFRIHWPDWIRIRIRNPGDYPTVLYLLVGGGDRL